ncbi:hypothetical protein ABZ153_25125 [Streptomyces sp. NPDC006290]|uniref:hypothetical protein n=1 Tax=Streptomyces sp. NPDC006290 TaxID=3156745 RepID=UPI0033B5CAE4
MAVAVHAVDAPPKMPLPTRTGEAGPGPGGNRTGREPVSARTGEEELEPTKTGVHPDG